MIFWGREILLHEKLKEAFDNEGGELTTIPITLDSCLVSDNLKKQIHDLGFPKVILAGQGNYVLTIGDKKQAAIDCVKPFKIWQASFEKLSEVLKEERSMKCLDIESMEAIVLKSNFGRERFLHDV